MMIFYALLAFIFFVYLVQLPLYKAIILVVVLAAFNFTYSFFFGLNPAYEPIYLKLVKDFLVLALFVNYFTKSCLSGKFKWFNSSVIFPLVFFLAYIFMITVAFWRGASVSLVVARYLLLFPLIAFITSTAFDSKEKIIAFFRMFFVLGVLVALIGLLQFIFSLGSNYYFGYVNMFGLTMGRATAMLGNPNNLATFLAVVAIFAFIFRLKGQKEITDQKLFWLWFILLLLGMFSTFSRGAFIFLLTCLELFLLLFCKTSIVKRIASLSAIILAVPAGFHVLSFRTGKSIFENERLDLWGGIITQFLQVNVRDFLFGFSGLTGDSLAQVTALALDGTTSFGLVTTDNMYLLLLLQLGVVGLLVFVLAIGILLIFNLRFYFRTKDMFFKSISIGVFFVLLYYLLSGISGPTLTVYPGALYFWVYIGFLFSLRKIERSIAN